MKENQISIFDFGLDDKGNYVNLVEEAEKERLKNWHDYPYEEIIKGYENDDDFCVVATFHMGCVSQYGLTIQEIQEEIKKEVATKCYHFGNMNKNLYIYSYRVDFEDGEKMYWLVVENEKHIVVIRHCGNIEDILTDKEQICYPACCVYLFEVTESGVKKITSGYGEKEKDIRYKILCGELNILEFSTNRIDPHKPPTDFYEAQYKFSDFMNYHGQSKVGGQENE